ncbi:MAG: two-component system, NarL family, response regulator NreC [Solirubrobacterales bacterium]|jgi:two-component system response regulator NreC|nr:two-component system, NarL family, response regulator NreC [Solirubrobacterales bacterium]
MTGDSESTPSADTVTVVIADDHELVRDGIRMVLEAEADIEVVAQAGDAEAGARYVLGHKPTILVLDLSMPGRPSLELMPQIIESSPSTSVIVVTMQNEPAFARQAFRAGAKGFVIKQSAADELIAAVRAVLAGQTYINPSLGARMAAEPEAPDGPPDDLTPRETEVLGLLALGYMNPEIADQLVLSVRTVETHRANIQRKTGISTRAELIAYAIENDLVER